MRALIWLLILGLATSSAAQFNITVDDNHNSIAYTTFPPWDTNFWPQQSPQPLDGTNHGTKHPGASATLQFSGTAVYAYGQKGRDNGFRNISVDSGEEIQCSGGTGQLGPRALLFSTSGLSQGRHTITITHTGMMGERLDIDYFLVTSGGEATILVPRASLAKRATTDVVAIAAGAGGGTVVILIILIFLFYYIGRRRRRLSGTPSVLTKRSRAPRLPLPNSTHYPGPSTEPIFDPHTSSYNLYSSNPSTTQEFNPYHPTAQMSVQYSDPRSTFGSDSIYSNQTRQVAQTVPNRLSPASRPMSTVSQPTSTVSQSLSTASQTLSTNSQPVPLRPGSHQQGSPYQQGGTYQQGGPYYQENSYQRGRGNYAGVGAETGPLVMSYDANAEQSRFTHLPEKRRPEEMDPVYQSSSNLAGGSSASIRAPARVQSTYRPTGTEQDGMSPPPGYYTENR